MKIIFLDTDTVTHDGDVSLSALESLGEWQAYPLTAPSEMPARLAEANIVISNKVPLNRAVIEAAPNLKLICVAATGTNNVDLDAAQAAGVQVCNVRGYSTESVAQHTLTMILNLVTNMHRYVAEPRAWADSPIFTRLDYPVALLEGMTLGIVGLGNIGTRVGELAEAFGMRVQGYARSGSGAQRSSRWPRALPQPFFQSSDIVSLHCPLKESTRALINDDTLGRMKPGAFLINTGRGELLDEAALLRSLRSGRLAGAGLDVLTQEPPPADHPVLLAAEELPQLLLTPHTAWSARSTRQELIDRLSENIRAFLSEGEAKNRVV